MSDDVVALSTSGTDAEDESVEVESNDVVENELGEMTDLQLQALEQKLVDSPFDYEMHLVRCSFHICTHEILFVCHRRLVFVNLDCDATLILCVKLANVYRKLARLLTTHTRFLDPFKLTNKQTKVLCFHCNHLNGSLGLMTKWHWVNCIAPLLPLSLNVP